MDLSRDEVYGSAWRKVRLAILERDDLCQVRGEGCQLVADQVDHVGSWRDGASVADPTNLRAACAHCNLQRGGRLGAAKSSARFSQRRPSREW
jgi:5-methylcytosine-specific restriction endonuclease McrA